MLAGSLWSLCDDPVFAAIKENIIGYFTLSKGTKYIKEYETNFSLKNNNKQEELNASDVSKPNP